MEHDDDFNPDSRTCLESATDSDFMDEILFEGYWLHGADGMSLVQPGPSISSAKNEFSQFLSLSQSNTYPEVSQGDTVGGSFTPLPGYFKIEELDGDKSKSSSHEDVVETCAEVTERSKRWWLAPKSKYPTASTNLSIKDRLVQAIGYFRECMEDRDFLIQIWVPVQREGRHVLITEEQPYTFNPKYLSLASYRNISKTYSFSADRDSEESVGFPGRVFLEKLPDWTPDVRFFKSEEYPRINYAEKYNVCGSLALPVFERGSGTCLGVIEIVTTTQSINYRRELEYVCKALEAVNLRSSHDFSSQSVEGSNKLSQAALPEIAEVLATVCKSHRLPLVLTWAPCVEQNKGGCRHSDENYSHCVSTVDSACFVTDEEIKGFHDACSEHHLLQGQGIVGRAFSTRKQLFATDITAFSKTNYPLSHHARMFRLHAALAIPLRSKYTGSVEFVLELFLPKDCLNTEEQKQMLNSLSAVVQQNFRSEYVVIDKELEEEVIFPVREDMITSDEILKKEETQNSGSLPSTETSPEESSWIAHMMEAQRKGKEVSLSWEYQPEEPKEEFKVTHWDNSQVSLYDNQVLSGLGKTLHNSGTQTSVNGAGESSSSGGRQILIGGRKPAEKRRTKMEKTISLQVLRQYFAGSLKDAAKSIGVCPTTLKRICRQHGITRWPSRKIKKVGHSLKKLQHVIDSVQGAEGSIQIESFYSSFPELSSPSLTTTNHHPKQSNLQPDNSLFRPGSAAPKSPSSSCSRSSGSSTCCSTGAKQQTTITNNASSSGNALTVEAPGRMMKRARSDANLHTLNQEEPKLFARSQSQKIFIEHPTIDALPTLPESGVPNIRPGGAIKIKATFGEVKIRFSLQPSWNFRHLQQEISRRLNIEDFSRMDLKYLDDDHEWVLLTCDDDLEECIDIYKSSESHTIKISLQEASQPKLGSSFGSTSPA